MSPAWRRRRDAPSRNGFEAPAPANLVERKQKAPGDPEKGSVKAELALLFALRDPGKGAQIGETLDDRSQGETLDVIVGGAPAGTIRAAAGWIRLIHLPTNSPGESG
jgi:hypothetical protein